jgi:short-subunit dehydrogenase
MTTRQTILITGATAGIGLDAARALARRGHTVIATGRNAEALSDLAARGQREGWDLTTLELDVSDSASIAAAAKRVHESTHGRGLDVLVNNAGYATVGPLAELSIDALRMELAAFGIDVVLVEPGTIRTRFAATTVREMKAERLDGSRYAAAYARAATLEHRFDRVASPVAPVTKTLIRAIEASRPCTRYVAPARFWLAIALVSVLPTRLVDGAMRWAFGLTRRQLERAPSGT